MTQNAPWPEGIDKPGLTRWMDEAGLEGDEIGNAEVLTGGTQNILLRFERGGREFVLRRPPAHVRANSNETIRREARVLAALGDTDVPHPRLIAACGDESVLGAAFYLMEPVEGFNPRYTLPSPHAESADMRRRMGFAMVEGIARLGRLDPAAVGLADFGRVEGFLERQPARWAKQLESYREHTGWPGPEGLGDVAGVHAWLTAHLPRTFRPGILHGDYHMSNVMFCNDGPELVAIVDWELCTLGDPLVDLGWLVATWPQPDGGQGPGIVGTSPWYGFPTAEELVVHYASFLGRPVDKIAWYAVLACYKLALIQEGTYARACAGKAPVETGERLHASSVALIARAQRWM